MVVFILYFENEDAANGVALHWFDSGAFGILEKPMEWNQLHNSEDLPEGCLMFSL